MDLLLLKPCHNLVKSIQLLPMLHVRLILGGLSHWWLTYVQLGWYRRRIDSLVELVRPSTGRCWGTLNIIWFINVTDRLLQVLIVCTLTWQTFQYSVTHVPSLPCLWWLCARYTVLKLISIELVGHFMQYMRQRYCLDTEYVCVELLLSIPLAIGLYTIHSNMVWTDTWCCMSPHMKHVLPIWYSYSCLWQPWRVNQIQDATIYFEASSNQRGRDSQN